MRATRFLAALPAALALAVGCGGQAGGDGLGAGAELAPASTAVFVAVDTEFDGDQWQAAMDLVGKFPGGRDAARELFKEFEEDDVDFERDVEPAVGPELDLVVLELAAGRETAVALTQPRDRKKFEELMRKGDEPVAYEMLDDWAVVAENREELERFQQARGDDSLAESDAFEDAMDDLPEDALARVYVNGDALMEELRAHAASHEDERALFEALLPGGTVPSFGAAARAEGEGVRFDAASKVKDADAPESYEADLPSELPAGALFYASFDDAADQLRDAIRRAGDANDEFDRQVAQAELALGVSLEEDVLPLLENEGALVAYPPPTAVSARPERSVPTVSLVLAVEDEARAHQTVERVAERAQAFVEEIRVRELEIAGVEAYHATAGSAGPELFYAVFDGKLVITTTKEGIEGLRAEGAKLADDDEYQAARKAANAPDETAGFAYADFEALAGAVGAEVPGEARENLEPLRSLFVYASADDERIELSGFLGID